MAVTIQSDMVRAADMMPKGQRAAFLVALIDYAEHGIEPEGRPVWLPTFETCKDRLDMSKEKHEKAKRMAAARWHKDEDSTMQDDAQASCTSIMHEHHPENENEKEKEKESEGEREKRKRFTPPTPEEVSEYAREKDLSLDANDFCDYYGAQGWRLSNGNPMRDWRQAVNRWARSKYRGGRDPKPNPYKGRYDHIRMIEEVG